MIRAEPLVTTLFTPSRGLERPLGFRVVLEQEGEELGGGAWKTRGRPWPRERMDGACARRDGAKRKEGVGGGKACPPSDTSEGVTRRIQVIAKR